MLADVWQKAPGKLLEVQRSPSAQDTSDVIFDSSFLDNSKRNIRLMGTHSVRRSVQMTIQAELESGKYGPILQGDTHKPTYFVTGQAVKEMDCNEVWAHRAPFCTQGAWFCFSERAPAYNFQMRIPLQNGDGELDVLGYVLLLKVKDSNYQMKVYDDTELEKKYRGFYSEELSALAKRDKLVLARENFAFPTGSFGNIPENEPDAYIFLEPAIKGTELTIAHTFRICGPRPP